MTEVMPFENRLWHRITFSDDCWTWNGALTKGYGHIYVDKKNKMVHRVVYELLTGPIPDQMQIDHLCRNRRCCNPRHLEAVDSRTNSLRGVGPTAINATKTHCPQGHEYTEENTYRSVKGRECRMCRRTVWVSKKDWKNYDPTA